MISPHFYPAVGGVETHLKDLCEYLSKKKHTVFVRTYQALASKEKGMIFEESEYLKIHRLPWPDFNLYFSLDKYPSLKFIYVFMGLFIDSLMFLLKNSQKIDVIQAHGLIMAFGAVILSKVFHKRIVVNTHVGFRFSKGFMTKIIKWTLINADLVLVLTKGVKKSLINIGIPEDRIEVYHYWVNQKTFSKQKNAKEKLGWEGKFTVLFVGRLIEVKGVNVIFDLAKQQKELTFVIIGSGPLRAEIEKKSKDFLNIIFIGKVKNVDLPIYYSASDVLLIPSKLIKQEYQEGIPRVMIEALSCGLPIITTPAGGIQDVFSSNIGVMVGDSAKKIKNALEKLSIDQDILKEARHNCRSFALKYFGIKNAEIIEKSLKESS